MKEEQTLIQCMGVSTGVSWLTQQFVNGKWGLGCSACRASGQSGKFSAGLIRSGGIQTLKVHAESNIHHLALQDLGVLTARTSDTKHNGDHPPIEDFMKVLKHRESGHSLRSGVVDVGGRFKITQMQWCLAEADRCQARDFLSRASSIAIAQDCRHNVLLMRYSASSEALVTQKGFLGAAFVGEGETITNVVKTMGLIVERFCSRGSGGPMPELPDECLFQKICGAVSVFVADAASNERGAGRASKSMFPNLLTVQRDRPHAATRIFERPWNADEEIKNTVNMCISVCQKIQHSPVLQAVFASLVKNSATCPTSTKRVKSLQSAKHRFASLSQPLGRFILHWDAILGTLLWIHAKRDSDDRKFAVQALTDWTETKLILVGMLADIADECIFLVRRCDRESYDISEFPVEVDAFVQRLHHLINEAPCTCPA